MDKTHVIADFYKADSDILAYSENLKKALFTSLKECNLELKQESFYQFEPQGVTALVITGSLHFNIHTWPEHGSCAIDMYCTEGYDLAVKVCDKFKGHLKAAEYEIKVLSRV